MDTLFFVLSKLLFFLLSPMMWIVTFLLLGILFKTVKWRKIFLWLTLGLILLFSNVALQSVIFRCWEMEALPAEMVRSSYTYAVVLGGMGERDSHSQKFVIERSIDRILQAVILYKRGKVQKILVTGGSGEVFNQDQKEAIDIKKFCCQLGIKSEDILVESESRNTYENARNTKKLIPYQREKILLITSAFHMRRSAAVFAKAGYQFDILATDPLIGHLSLEDYFLPQAKAIENWLILIKEVVGYCAYGLMGYL